jgi:hypothetical protein
MRSKIRFVAILALSITVVPVCAFSSDAKTPEEMSIDALEAKASQAQPREQCFLYAQLVNEMTEMSLHRYASGDIEKADGLLQRIQQLAQKIHLSLAGNDKRLKNAEILLSKTSFRLNEMLHSSDYDDRSLVEATLAKVNQAQDEAMMQVFQK